MDRLEQIFALQEKLDKKIIAARDINFDYDTWIQKEILAIIAELAEVLEETNYKWWKNAKKVKEDHIKEELIDVFHFFISLCLKVGITPNDLFEAYQKKNTENILRQDGLSDKEGYSIS